MRRLPLPDPGVADHRSPGRFLWWLILQQWASMLGAIATAPVFAAGSQTTTAPPTPQTPPAVTFPTNDAGDGRAPPLNLRFSNGDRLLFTSQLGVLSWNQMLLYPKGTPSDKIEMQATLKVPTGWRYGTRLMRRSAT